MNSKKDYEARLIEQMVSQISKTLRTTWETEYIHVFKSKKPFVLPSHHNYCSALEPDSNTYILFIFHEEDTDEVRTLNPDVQHELRVGRCGG